MKKMCLFKKMCPFKKTPKKKGGIWIFSFFSTKFYRQRHTLWYGLKEEVMLEFSTSCRKVHYSSCCQIPRLKVSHPVLHIDIGILNQFLKVGRSEINSSKHVLTLDGGHLGNQSNYFGTNWVRLLYRFFVLLVIVRNASNARLHKREESN